MIDWYLSDIHEDDDYYQIIKWRTTSSHKLLEIYGERNLLITNENGYRNTLH